MPPTARMTRSLLTTTLAAACALAALPGCTTGSKLRAKSVEVDQLNELIQKRAYKCAPREYALARSHADFGRYELSEGNWMRADEHLIVAFKNAEDADIKSQRDECLDTPTVVQRDTDGDGILDSVDKCPTEPEDFDKFEDEDGCPEDQDTDGDGIFDQRDMCPTEPGTQENNGCPNVVTDKDKDGIPDTADKCPLDPEDRDDFEDDDGCPDADNDQDGLLDEVDKCPNEPEDKDGFEDEDGCPDFDNDNDKILDEVDKCPNEPEDYDGDQDDDGCPDEYKLVVVEQGRINIKQKIYFDTARWTIKTVSYPVLNEVAQVLRDRPEIKIRIEGHTDSVGNARRNKTLSEKRAASVREYLVGQGVSAGRMTSKGYGEEKAIADNKTRSGREENRRVEFYIVD